MSYRQISDPGIANKEFFQLSSTFLKSSAYDFEQKI